MNAKDVMARYSTQVHRWIFTTSKGRMLGNFRGMPVVVLTTTGRKSGKSRSTMLTAPVAEAQRVVLVASYGGDDRNPTWFLNLRAHPDVQLTMGGSTKPMRARVATSDEKTELWPAITAANPGYGEYQKKTERDIPVVILEP
jgi:deazaflavin-dependent oxidoreductase (nitroreductase family)